MTKGKKKNREMNRNKQKGRKPEHEINENNTYRNEKITNMNKIK